MPSATATDSFRVPTPADLRAATCLDESGHELPPCTEADSEQLPFVFRAISDNGWQSTKTLATLMGCCRKVALEKLNRAKKRGWFDNRPARDLWNFGPSARIPTAEGHKPAIERWPEWKDFIGAPLTKSRCIKAAQLLSDLFRDGELTASEVASKLGFKHRKYMRYGTSERPSVFHVLLDLGLIRHRFRACRKGRRDCLISGDEQAWANFLIEQPLLANVPTVETLPTETKLSALKIAPLTTARIAQMLDIVHREGPQDTGDLAQHFQMRPKNFKATKTLRLARHHNLVDIQHDFVVLNPTGIARIIQAAMRVPAERSVADMIPAEVSHLDLTLIKHGRYLPAVVVAIKAGHTTRRSIASYIQREENSVSSAIRSFVTAGYLTERAGEGDYGRSILAVAKKISKLGPQLASDARNIHYMTARPYRIGGSRIIGPHLTERERLWLSEISHEKIGFRNEEDWTAGMNLIEALGTAFRLLTYGALADEIGCERQSVRRIARRLKQVGLVESADPADSKPYRGGRPKLWRARTENIEKLCIGLPLACANGHAAPTIAEARSGRPDPSAADVISNGQTPINGVANGHAPTNPEWTDFLTRAELEKLYKRSWSNISQRMRAGEIAFEKKPGKWLWRVGISSLPVPRRPK